MFDAFVGVMQSILTFFYNAGAKIGFANHGLAIILMTLVIKAVLAPLTVKQVKSMKEMQLIQPKMKELQEKFKGNPEKMNQEIAELYRSHKINPLAGCLPLLLQMPFLIAIFYAIRDYNYGAVLPSFLWVTDLSKPDHLYILPVLSAFTTFIQQKMSTMEMTQQTKMMMWMMPIFIGYISLQFPAGLVLYWVVSNIFQIIQQYYMYRDQAKPVVQEAK